MLDIIPYAKHEITDSDVQYVSNVLKSGFLTGGPTVITFEDNFKNYTNAQHALSTSSGTAALHLAVQALGGEKGKKVIVPSLTFAASANAAIYSGFDIEFIDIDPDTLLIDIGMVEKKLNTNPELYVGVIAVDFAGSCVDVKALSKICKKYNIWLIEDAAHSVGGKNTYDNNDNFYVGEPKYVDAVAFSFHPAKNITTGEGGMITTNNNSLYQKMRLLRSHHMNRDISGNNQQGWLYEISELGFNYRMSDLNAALGISQLSRIDQIIEKRGHIANFYDAALSIPEITLTKNNNNGHAHHLYVIQLNNRNDLYNYLQSKNILPQVHYVPLHMQPYYSRYVNEFTNLPHTENYYSRCLSIPMYSTLSKNQQKYVVDSILDFVSLK